MGIRTLHFGGRFFYFALLSTLYISWFLVGFFFFWCLGHGTALALMGPVVRDEDAKIIRSVHKSYKNKIDHSVRVYFMHICAFP